jgi:hypothetical protein
VALRATAGTVLYLAVIALLSLGVATAVRDAAMAIEIVLACSTSSFRTGRSVRRYLGYTCNGRPANSTARMTSSNFLATLACCRGASRPAAIVRGASRNPAFISDRTC